eukprot:5476095-Amphidinium_carterae.1
MATFIRCRQADSRNWRSPRRCHKPSFQFGTCTSLARGPAGLTPQRMVVYVFPACVHTNVSVTIQTNGVGRMLNNTLMRPNHKRNSREIGLHDRNYLPVAAAKASSTGAGAACCRCAKRSLLPLLRYYPQGVLRPVQKNCTKAPKGHPFAKQ